MKKSTVIKMTLIALIIAALIICMFITPGWFRKKGPSKREPKDRASFRGGFTYTVSPDIADGVKVDAAEVDEATAKRCENADKYALLGTPISFESEQYDGVILGDDVLYTVDIPGDADVDRLVFIYFDDKMNARYLTPDIIDTDKRTMSVYLPHFSIFGAAELTPEEQIEVFLDDYSMRIAMERLESKTAAAELEPYVRAKVEAMGITKAAAEDLIQSTLNYMGSCFKGPENDPYKYGDTIETGTKFVTTLTRGVIDGDRDAMERGLEDTLSGALMHAWGDLKFSERIDEVLGSEFAGASSKTLLGSTGGIARMAGYMMEGDWTDAANELGGVLQSVAPQAELVTKGAGFLAALGNMAFTNWKSNQVEELYQIYKNGVTDIWHNEVYPGDRESFLQYLNTSSGFTMAKGVGRFYNLDNIDAICKQYGWDFETYKDIPEKYRAQFEARAEEGLMEYFELRRSQEAEAEKIKEDERACINEMLNYSYGVLEAGNYKQFFGEASDKDFNMRARLDRLVNVRKFISQYVDEAALKNLKKSDYNYGTLLNEWIRYASQYKKEEAVDKFCTYLKDIGAYKSGSNDKPGNDPSADNSDWFVGTWCVFERASGFATKIELVDQNTVAITRMDITHVDEGSTMKKMRAYYSAELQRSPDGSYVIIGAGLDENGEEAYSAMKLFKPADGSNSLKMILAPREVKGTDKYEYAQEVFNRE